MLKDIYNTRKETIDEVIKTAIKGVEKQMHKIDLEDNKEVIEKIEENYNIKLGAVCEDLYIQGLKDGINLMKECEK